MAGSVIERGNKGFKRNVITGLASLPKAAWYLAESRFFAKDIVQPQGLSFTEQNLFYSIASGAIARTVYSSKFNQPYEIPYENFPRPANIIQRFGRRVALYTNWLLFEDYNQAHADLERNENIAGLAKLEGIKESAETQGRRHAEQKIVRGRARRLF